MAIVSMGYTKVLAEKARKKHDGQITIKNNIAITNVTEGSSAQAAQKAIMFSFSFQTEYSPGVGNITIEGFVVDIQEEAKAKEVLMMWDKHKRVEKDITQKVVALILDKCNIKALVLSQDVSLPSPIPLPTVKINAVHKRADRQEVTIDTGKQDSKDKKAAKKR